MQSQEFPTKKGDRNVSIEPQEIVKPAQAECIARLPTRFRQEIVNLQLSNLVGNRLPRTGCEECRLGMRCAGIHWDRLLQVVSRLRNRKLAKREFHVNFDSKGAKAHEIPDEFTGTRAVIEQACVQHHLFRVESDAFVGAGVVVVATNGIRMGPRKRELKVMPRDAL